MASVKFLELARDELDDLFESYEYKQKNLGYDFIQEVKNTLLLIDSYPSIWSKKSAKTQRCFIKGYPYGIIYQKVDGTIYVVAVMNLLKKPIHWVSKSTSHRISHLPETIYVR